MPGPKTLGGFVVAKHGVRTWWHVQRLLIAYGTGAVVLKREPTQAEVIEVAYNGADSTFFRDLQFFRKVWSERTPFEVWAVCAEGRRGTPVDLVMTGRAL